MADESHMVMAGLWDEWNDKKTGERVKSCTIVTSPANALVGARHDRMPVIVAEEMMAVATSPCSVGRRRSGERGSISARSGAGCCARSVKQKQARNPMFF